MPPSSSFLNTSFKNKRVQRVDYLWSGDQMVQVTPIYADGPPREIFSEKGIVSWAGRLNTRGQMAFWQSHDNYADNDPEYTECHFRFAGQYEDKESGLYYNRFRYYGKGTGQYISPDPIGLLDGFNPYGYVHCPTGWVDPFGLAGTSSLKGTLARGDINSNIVGGVKQGYAGHHLIGIAEAKKYPVMHKAAEMGYNINRSENGIALPTTVEESLKTGLLNDKEALFEAIGKAENNIRNALLNRDFKLQKLDPNFYYNFMV